MHMPLGIIAAAHSYSCPAQNTHHQLTPRRLPLLLHPAFPKPLRTSTYNSRPSTATCHAVSHPHRQRAEAECNRTASQGRLHGYRGGGRPRRPQLCARSAAGCGCHLLGCAACWQSRVHHTDCAQYHAAGGVQAARADRVAEDRWRSHQVGWATGVDNVLRSCLVGASFSTQAIISGAESFWYKYGPALQCSIAVCVSVSSTDGGVLRGVPRHSCSAALNGSCLVSFS